MATVRMHLTAALLCLLAARGLCAPVYLWEGFEREITWDYDGASAATGRVLDDANFTEGARGLKLPFRSVGPAHRAVWSRGVDADWSPYGALLLDVFNPSGPPDLKLSVVITSSDRSLAHEAHLGALAPGWNRDVRVDLKAPVWSSAASDFRPVGHLVGRGRVQRIALRLLPGTATEGWVTVDHLRLERAGILTFGQFALNATLDLTASAGDLDYLPPGMRIRSRDLTALESFETGGIWTTGQPGVLISPAAGRRSHGATALAVSFPAAPDGFEVSLDGLETRLAGTRQLRMDVFCEGPWARLQLILVDGDGNEYESDSRWAGHGWTTPVFDFTNQFQWNGTVISPEVLAGLSAVRMRIISRSAGRLVFDGLASAAVALKGAAKPGAVAIGSWTPSEAFEWTAEARVEDTWYGRTATAPRGAGPEGWLDSARARWDAGGFRTTAFYRRRIAPLDQQMFQLLSPRGLGSEIAGVESGGRIGRAQLQLLAASRIEYERYNSRRPTRFGPEQVALARARGDLVEGTRIGATWLGHRTRFAVPVPEVPGFRQTVGADLESRHGTEGLAVNLAAAGGWTFGPAFRDPDVNAPDNDRAYAAAAVSPKWGRLALSANWALFGYDFDGEMASDGGNWAGPYATAQLDLDGLPPARALTALLGRTAGNNLALSGFWTDWEIRDRFSDPATVRLRSRYRQRSAGAALANDEQARPNFRIAWDGQTADSQWWPEHTDEGTLYVRVPLPADVVAIFWGTLETSRETDRSTGESGRGWERTGSVWLERYFKGNLFLTGGAEWRRSRRGWLDVWDDPEDHVQAKAGARRTFGADTYVQVDFGAPALYGSSPSRDTINVVTVLVRSYF